MRDWLTVVLLLLLAIAGLFIASVLLTGCHNAEAKTKQPDLQKWTFTATGEGAVRCLCAPNREAPVVVFLPSVPIPYVADSITPEKQP